LGIALIEHGLWDHAATTFQRISENTQPLSVLSSLGRFVYRQEKISPCYTRNVCECRSLLPEGIMSGFSIDAEINIANSYVLGRRWHNAAAWYHTSLKTARLALVPTALSTAPEEESRQLWVYRCLSRARLSDQDSIGATRSTSTAIHLWPSQVDLWCDVIVCTRAM